MAGTDLDGIVALVTGGAVGIGRAICLDLAASGAKVIATDREEPAGTVAEVREADGEAIGIVADVTDPGAMARAVRSGVATFGGIDVLVNNAGIFASLKPRPFAEIPLAEWRTVMEVNVLGSAVAATAVLPAMRARGAGSIVNISSTTALKGTAWLAHYSASKGAILAMTKTMARELGPESIRVNAVAPGFTVSAGVEQNAEQTAKMRGAAAGSRVLGREMAPSDIVGAVRFLASSQSGFITGQTIVVDGGAHFH